MKIFSYIGNIVSGIFDPLIINRTNPPLSDPKRIDLSQFDLVFEENFDGDEIDKTKWRVYRHPDKKAVIRKGGFWSASQAKIIDGRLHITTEHKKDGDMGAGYYTEAINTSGLFEQRYGYFECRCKLPAAEGLWAAFWLHSENVGFGRSGKEGTEIDIFESPLFSRKKLRNSVVSNLHYNGYGISGKSKRLGAFAVDDPYGKFNTYGLEWNEKEYIFYINGVETCRTNFGGVSRQKQFMILSVEVDGVGGKPLFGWSGNIKNNPEGTLPVDFVVDYVRVYQYKK